VWAAPSPGETELIRERQNRLLQEQRRRLDELKELPGKPVEPALPTAPADTRCFPVKGIDIKGAEHLSPSERESLLKPYVGQCVGVTQLDELLKVITQRYIDKGLVTSRAYLPQQDLSGGQLSLLVVEGRLEQLQAVPDAECAKRRAGQCLDAGQP
jgi:hemolysin activation/secretion protein